MIGSIKLNLVFDLYAFVVKLNGQHGLVFWSYAVLAIGGDEEIVVPFFRGQ